MVVKTLDCVMKGLSFNESRVCGFSVWAAAAFHANSFKLKKRHN